MARVAIVSSDVQTIFGNAGGAGAFSTRWANLLRQAGETVTIVMTRADREPMRVDPRWRALYQKNEISLIELQAPPALATRRPEIASMRMAEIAAPVLRVFDIVYFQDQGNAAFDLVRARRYSAHPGPVCVTVLHGPSEWQLSSMRRYPELPNDLHLAWLERYSARNCDFVVSPSLYMAERLRALGWEFPSGVEVLGLPMPEAAVVSEQLPAAEIRRIVYFGAVEERKGIQIFVAALQSFARSVRDKPRVVLLGPAEDPELLQLSLRDLRAAGFAASHEGSLDSEQAGSFLRKVARETLCVIPGSPENFPYRLVEASLIAGLNVIACRGGGVPEVLPGSAAHLCDPLPGDLADKIAERVRAPLASSELARYDCRAANEKWLEFHRKALASANARGSRAVTGRNLSIDVCVTYFQKAAYLGQLMDALERQTEADFHVIAVNDGSPDEESNRVFEEQAARGRSRGWDFYRQANAFVDAARNSAARRGTGDLILFVDADDVPARNAIARMREAIARSGDDALICASYLFASEKRPFDPATGDVEAPAFATCIPLGMDLVGGLLNPLVFGGSMFIVRRSVFDHMGGFRERRGAGHEDWEFYVRLALAGYKIDVLPELLQFYRQVEGSLARTLAPEASTRRLLDAYEESLRTLGLEGSALALAGLHRSAQEKDKELRRLRAQAAAPMGRYAFFSAERNAFGPGRTTMERLRLLYRELVPIETRLEFHRKFLAPFVGPYRPPGP
jgi:glycosyltransferase involved in cell wall biosynthesis